MAAWQHVESISSKCAFVRGNVVYRFTRSHGSVREREWIEASGPISQEPNEVEDSTLAAGTVQAFQKQCSGVQVQFQLKLSSTDDAMRDAEIVGQKRRDTAFVVLRWYLLRNPPERESSEPGLPFERGSQKRIDHYAELYSGKLECDLGGDDSSGYQTRENGQNLHLG